MDAPMVELAVRENLQDGHAEKATALEKSLHWARRWLELWDFVAAHPTATVIDLIHGNRTTYTVAGRTTPPIGFVAAHLSRS